MPTTLERRCFAAGINGAQAALRWLGAEPPNLEEVRQALGYAVNEGNRAIDIIGRIRTLVKKAPPRKEAFAINEAILEVVGLTRGEAMKHNISVQTQLAEGLPRLQGDKVQLQQVILNLIINAVEAMSSVREGSRELLISTTKDVSGVLVAVPVAEVRPLLTELARANLVIELKLQGFKSLHEEAMLAILHHPLVRTVSRGE